MLQVNLRRQKNWHHKTRTGCLVCRLRRIKCDEGQPECERCLKRGHACKYAEPPAPKKGPTLVAAPGDSLLNLDKHPLSQHDFEFYFHAGASMLAQWQCPYLFYTSLPATSGTSLATRYALLALSTTTQQFTNTSTDAIQIVRKRGGEYYTQACRLSSLGHNITVLEALHVSFALWSYDWFFGRKSQSFVHANAAVKLYISLRDLNFPVWPVGVSRASCQVISSVAHTFFCDVHFPIDNLVFLKMLDERSRIANHETTGHDPVLSCTENPFLKLANPDKINSFFWVCVIAYTKQQLLVAREALENCAVEDMERPLPRSAKQEIYQNQVSLIRMFCDLHLDYDSSSKQANKDQLMSQMLDLVQLNMVILMEGKEASGQQRADHTKGGVNREGIHCYLGLLGLVSKEADSPEVRARAFTQITSHGQH